MDLLLCAMARVVCYQDRSNSVTDSDFIYFISKAMSCCPSCCYLEYCVHRELLYFRDDRSRVNMN